MESLDSAGQWLAALSLLQEMLAARLDFIPQARFMAISACSRAGCWQAALWATGFAEIPEVTASDLDSFGILLMECEQRDLHSLELSMSRRLSAAARQGDLLLGLAAVLDFSADVRSVSYLRELALLRYVLETAQPGSPATVADAFDAFGLGPGPSSPEAQRNLLWELGFKTGCCFARRVTTLELDPILVAIARTLVAFAGLCGAIDVWTGHSALLLPPQTPTRRALADSSAIFMDRWGYDKDFALIQEHELLSGGVLVADNVLTTAAASFLWNVAGPTAPFASQVVAVSEVADSSQEVSKCQHEPKQWVAERRVIVEGGSGADVAKSEKPAFTQHSKATLARAGLGPMPDGSDSWHRASAAATDATASGLPSHASQVQSPELELLLGLAPTPSSAEADFNRAREVEAKPEIRHGGAERAGKEPASRGFMCQSGIEVNVFHCSSAISAYEKGGDWLGMLTGMDASDEGGSAAISNAAISACEKGGQWQLALGLLKQMPASKIAPDVVCFSAAISACEKGGQWRLALDLLTVMPQMKCNPNVVSYSSAISACEKGGQWQLAMELLAEMPEMRNLAVFRHVRKVASGSVAGALQLVASRDAAFEFLGKMLDLWQLSQQLAREQSMSRPVDLQIVSRLDHPTSGVVPVATGVDGSPAANWLQAQFAGRLVEKEYLCLCEGPPLGAVGSKGDISTPLLTVELDNGRVCRTETSPLGREAFTSYEVLARYLQPEPADPSQEPATSELMLLLVRPKTGRTHQIRVLVLFEVIFQTLF
ncbi:unnamed protein product [Polarella glacialis]|uniref:Pseudouridine synthase RsuA/RluA-like domain-containing protein n=1 Tax=Polarella glacialis TaxID=89957 RepID=A0A813I2A8_POLGL|nr:unnamed protein product [Polarella glacialis]